MLRKRVWLNTPWHNYTDKKKNQLTNSEINLYKLYEEDNVAFNQGDFVNCECVTKPSVPVLNKQPNYMIVYNGTTIESRYYVLSYQYMDGEPAENFGTYRATFIRDVVVDFKRSLTQQLCRIRRGSLPTNQFSPILVQPEGISLNEIKVNQLYIKAWDGDAQWLTIFYDQTVPDNNRKITFDWSGDIYPDYQFSTMQSDYSSYGFNLTTTGLAKSTYKRDFESYEIILRGSNAMERISVVVTKDSITATAVNPLVPSTVKNAVSALNNASVNQIQDVVTLIRTVYQYDNSSKIMPLVNKYNNQLIQDGSKINRTNITVNERLYETAFKGTTYDSSIKTLLGKIAGRYDESSGLYGIGDMWVNGGYDFQEASSIMDAWQT